MKRCGRPQNKWTLLALGIPAIPKEQARRQYIRGWLRAANTGTATSSQHGLVLEHRFALGTKYLRGTTHQLLRREHAELGDLAIMREQREGKEHLSEKSLRWFVLAPSLFPCAHFIGKADPDTFLVWERLGVQLRLLLSSRRALDRRVLVGTGFDWTSVASSSAPGVEWPGVERAPHACGCCGRSPSAAWGLQLNPKAMWGACDFRNRSSKYSSGGWSHMLNASLEGPFPYAFGTFYAVSQPLARWLAASTFMAHAVTQLGADQWGRQMAYTEDLVFGWAVSHAANTSAVSFHQGSFDNFDAARGTEAHHRLAPECFSRHGLGPANFTTGKYSKWGKCCAEFITPRQVRLSGSFGLGLS